MSGEQILVYYLENGNAKIEVCPVSDGILEETVNGESGYHVYHVKMITELVLRKLCETMPELALSEEDISAISMASALHDIGKMQIPQDILNSPRSLSPVEYDIVKKHAAFGENMIRSAEIGNCIEERAVEYAAQIAKSHHERVDGTGYPKGLRGDDIPLCAKVVALADSYDALTSSRSYKEAFSQDVALQMISSGMCGVFDEFLVECLMEVINHRSLVEFREKILKAGRVVEDGTPLNLKRVLLAGNTEYLTRDFIDETFPQCKVTVIGNTRLENEESIKLFRIGSGSIKSVLETYVFDLIVFFSSTLTFDSNENNADELRELLLEASMVQRHARILYLSSLDANFVDKTDRAIISNANERLCEYYAKKNSLDLKLLQIPYLYSGTVQKDFLYRIFEQVYEGNKVFIPESERALMHFISLTDLSELLSRIIDNWTSGNGILSVGNEFHITFANLGAKIRRLGKMIKPKYAETDFSGELKTTNRALRSEYGWFARISILDEIAEQYEEFLKEKPSVKRTFASVVRSIASGRSSVVKIIELILMFLATELLIHITDSAVIFSIVDFRIIFIVIMATLYGLTYGIAAASLESVSYFVARVLAGTNAMTIFYEPTNWLAFVFFFLVGGLCGYVNLRKEDKNKYLEEQNKLIVDKLVFTREIYEDAIRDKRDLKKQIISSKDSFGKIFDITRKLNTVAPQELYLRIIETFEDILENKSITVYSIKPGTAFGRLEVASRDLLDAAARSISVDTYAEVIEAIRDGEIWKNTTLETNKPAYAAGVYRGGELVLVIFLWQAGIDQRSLYYVNLFKILRDLVQMSLLRAYDYNSALLEKQYIESTRIMKAEYFEETLRNFEALAEKKISTYILLEFDLCGHTLREADEMIAGKIRVTDVLGITSDDRLILLLSQATPKDLDFILPRFEGLDIKVKVL